MRSCQINDGLVAANGGLQLQWVLFIRDKSTGKSVRCPRVGAHVVADGDAIRVRVVEKAAKLGQSCGTFHFEEGLQGLGFVRLSLASLAL